MIAALLCTTKFSSTGIKPIVPGKSATCANHRHFAGAMGSARPSPAGDPPSDRLCRLVLVCRPPWAEIQPRDSRLAQDQFPFLPQAPALVGNRVPFEFDRSRWTGFRPCRPRRQKRRHSRFAKIYWPNPCNPPLCARRPPRIPMSGFASPEASVFPLAAPSIESRSPIVLLSS